MPQLIRQNLLLPAPPTVTLHDPRTHLRRLPPAYSNAQTPFSRDKDFAPQLRYQLELPRKPKLRPCKVIFVGDCAVGKTAIVNRFCFDKFQCNYKATIGVDFELENFNILGHNFSLEMWDTAGQERFKCIAGAYYRNASVIVATYDMSKRETLDSAKKWLSSALNYNTAQKPIIFLVGTKSDLLTKEEFMRMERIAGVAAAELGAEYWSLSARSGFKITEFFQRLAALAFEKAAQQQLKTFKSTTQEQTKQTSEKSQRFDLRSYFSSRSGKQKSGCAC
ncbi:ras-related protein Rab-34 [Drosophila grimshawi]|uniref:Ras-related protein Rab-36 n=1 Tax=Drosophila grimshawi TaxID=7222 RepID=B4J1Y1_DROGR|nr:ras-related protein Rab-34 [Drosophila grimshawi]XP_032596955.1 ras-related protein Rab-34 [Drosophila grimshawi]EDV95906.1 GH15514 [Drosophila grimshawi]